MSKPTDADETAKSRAKRLAVKSYGDRYGFPVLPREHTAVEYGYSLAAAELAAYRERLRVAVDELSLVDNHAGCYNDAVADVLELIGELCINRI